ncbi:hypothetical protein [Pelagicoccus mobilis]|nr:hypothetical protein [Pelagicoccus mobilis]
MPMDFQLVTDKVLRGEMGELSTGNYSVTSSLSLIGMNFWES